MKNWRTTVVGIIGAVVSAAWSYVQYGGLEPVAIVQAAAIGALGYLAKDAGVSGTEK